MIFGSFLDEATCLGLPSTRVEEPTARFWTRRRFSAALDARRGFASPGRASRKRRYGRGDVSPGCPRRASRIGIAWTRAEKTTQPRFGFVGLLDVGEVLLLWDRVLGYQDLSLLPAVWNSKFSGRSDQCPGKPAAVADFWSDFDRFCSNWTEIHLSSTV